MRLWSFHPTYLDTAGLVACWREALLAQAVLHGKTRGYQTHSQLVRFKAHPDPHQAIADYLWVVHDEACGLAYNFDGSKILRTASFVDRIPVTTGQLDYERQHLLRKLFTREPSLYVDLADVAFAVHPLFAIVEGPVEPWERVK